jgi:hypothetical protein
MQILADPPNGVLHKAFERFARFIEESHCCSCHANYSVSVFLCAGKFLSVCIATFGGNTETKKKIESKQKYNFFCGCWSCFIFPCCFFCVLVNFCQCALRLLGHFFHRAYENLEKFEADLGIATQNGGCLCLDRWNSLKHIITWRIQPFPSS